jgi:hypothetical protein
MDIKRLKISIHLPGFGKTAIAEGTSDNNKVGKATPNPKNININAGIYIFGIWGCFSYFVIIACSFGNGRFTKTRKVDGYF